MLGPNGAGKSTLMRAILGLVPLAAGSVAVLGGRPAQARPEIGYLPQRRELRPRHPDARASTSCGSALDGARWGVPGAAVARGARARRRAERARVERGDRAGRRRRLRARAPIGELSGGEQQRLLIAQALVRSPELLILDEPLDSLDLPNQVAVAALMRRICTTEGVAVLLVAHDVNPLLGYLDRVVYLGRRPSAGGHRRRGDHGAEADRACTGRRSRCCGPATAGWSWSGSPRPRTTTATATTT